MEAKVSISVLNFILKSKVAKIESATPKLSQPALAKERIMAIMNKQKKPNAKILVKVENETNGAIGFEVEKTMTMTNAWETISFDFSAGGITSSIFL